MPNNPDTDGDGFNDGIEDANPGLAGPLNPGFPGFGAVLYDFTNIQESVNQNDNLHRLMPVFNPVDGLSFAYIVAASPGYTNPRIAIATVGDLNSETFITDPGDLSSPFNFHQLTYKSDGSAVLFDNGKDIFAASTLGGGVAQLTNMEIDSSVYNPEVVKIDGIDYLVAGFSTGATKSLVGWEYNASPTNEDDITTVVNINEGSFLLENNPHMSYNGRVGLFTVKNNLTGGRYLYLGRDLNNILSHTANPITNSLSDDRIRRISFGEIGLYPMGIGLIGNLGIWSLDRNSNFNQDNPDFTNSQFEILVGSFSNINTSDNQINLLSYSVIPFPGNQPFASLDKNGTKLILCSDFNPFLPGKSEFSLLDMSLGVGVKVNDGYITGPLTVIDPSGVNLTFYEPDVVDIPSGQPTRIKVFTPRIQSTSEVVNIRTFEPSGTTFTPGGSGPGGIKLTYAYRDEDIQNLVESTLKIAAYDILAATTVILPTTVDAENNSLEARITHFSSYAITGDQIPGPASVENWALQE